MHGERKSNNSWASSSREQMHGSAGGVKSRSRCCVDESSCRSTEQLKKMRVQFKDDLKLRPVKRMDVAEKKELHAEMRALQQQRGEFKRKIYELELKKT